MASVHSLLMHTMTSYSFPWLSLVLILCSELLCVATCLDQGILPHIIFVVIDDLGSKDLGRHGSGIHTPTLDQLSHEGVFLENYYVLPYCSPTRATIMSGRYPLHTGCHTIVLDYETQGLPLDEETLPQVLRKVGYQTHAVGKWHIGHSSSAQTPTFRGFQTFKGFLHGGSDYFTHIKPNPRLGAAYEMRNDKREFCGPQCTEMIDERGNYSTNVFTSEAIRIIENHDAKQGPLFLYLAHQAVHFPDQVPDEYLEPYRHHQDWSEQRKVYAAMLAAVDESVKNVTETLKSNGYWNNTILIATTDNGGPTDVCMVQGSSNGRARGGKCSVWNGGTTGDAFLAGPALRNKLKIEPKAYKNLFHAVDWLPTLANMTGAKPDGKPLDGVSHVMSLQQKVRHELHTPRQELFVGYAKYDIRWDMDDSASMQTLKTAQWYGPAIRWQNWKLIQGPSGGPDNADTLPRGTDVPAVGGTNNSSYLLYNLDSDPEERQDLSLDFPMILQLMKDKLRVYQKTFVSPIAPDPSCPFHGIVNTSQFGPTWVPWCDHASEIVFTTKP